ncbi:MAG: SDR family NAD(P)-dependent oxidoreductase [Parvularculaceae bacterium]|nr:SDR family NAD(P)-dependent oxidoreductase [Parvularculaceae bacterium]
MTGSLEGKVALVTGASSGIGEASALALARAGVRVVVSARRAERLADLVKRIESAGGTACAAPGDVSDADAAAAIVDEAKARWKRLDIVVNSAGVLQAGGVENADLAEWRRVIEINLMAVLYVSRAAIPHLKGQGGGDIVNISSTAGRRAAGIFGPYSTSKFGLTGLSEGMRQELGGAGIRVCVIEPGATTTEVAEGVSNPQLRAAMRQHVGKEGAMAPADVADAVVFVVSLPRRANVSQLLIRPTIDVAPM